MGPRTGLSPPPLPCRPLAPHRAPAAIPPEAASGNPAPSGRHLRTWPRPQAACPQLAPGCPALGSRRPLWRRPLRPRSGQPSRLTSGQSRRLASTPQPALMTQLLSCPVCASVAPTKILPHGPVQASGLWLGLLAFSVTPAPHRAPHPLPACSGQPRTPGPSLRPLPGVSLPPSAPEASWALQVSTPLRPAPTLLSPCLSPGFLQISSDSRLVAVQGPAPSQPSCLQGATLLPEAFASPATHFRPVVLAANAGVAR